MVLVICVGKTPGWWSPHIPGSPWAPGRSGTHSHCITDELAFVGWLCVAVSVSWLSYGGAGLGGMVDFMLGLGLAEWLIVTWSCLSYIAQCTFMEPLDGSGQRGGKCGTFQKPSVGAVTSL